MSEQTSQEPTMEEILASIRRIISEDDAPVEEGAEAAPEAAAEEPAAEATEPEPAPEAEPDPVSAAEPEPVASEPEPAHEEEALELTDKVETLGDLDVVSTAAAEPEAAPAPVEALVSERVATAAASSFGALS